MSDVVIKVENLSKKYLIRHEKRERYTALRDVMTKGVKRMFNRGIVQPFKRLANSTTQQFNDLTSASLSNSTIQQSSSSTTEEFWALKDINFEVKRGERVGIIGRNGAGKTTLLKLLSRITEPTTGRITLKGRVASLLEVGTGFHPELTGRENIFLNGAILGMGKDEIKNKFDEIVDFAEIEKFLDTPVKRYSSGMYVRLAFAVAAHLEPEILIVDEVLAVGDAQFQKKCLGKMEEVSAKEGRTVLFVSHNMVTISSLCQRCMLLDSGELRRLGNTSDIIIEYFSQGGSSPASFDYTDCNKLIGEHGAVLLSGRVVNKSGNVDAEIDIREKFTIEMIFKVMTANKLLSPNFHFLSADGSYVFVTCPQRPINQIQGTYKVVCEMPGNFLNEGTYFVGLALTAYPGTHECFFHKSALSFIIKDPIANVPTRGGTDYAGPMPGIVRPLLNWTISNCE